MINQKDNQIIGDIHSFQSLGAVDGEGVRFVVFMQGCPLRCKCCHNPDTWEFGVGKKFTAEQVFQKVIRYKEYFGNDGGITLSGGEPLMQSKFATQLFCLCKQNGINTCLDTSGCKIDKSTKELLNHTDRVLLDVKYTNQEDYLENATMEYSALLEFLNLLDKKNVKTTVRQVIIPSVNDDEQNVLNLKRLKSQFACIDKIELLSFKKICQVKYDKMGIAFPFADKNQPSNELMDKLNNLLNC